ncbi:LysR family transcriptional regulator [Streptomyces rugosispiralis]|uniref:LysR family transcriptional regulator n=1 Tax=Streptomyces rugosispiralis TaxID=2967341 RepID=A0ABT1V885_9ACTN|nr:LysR family transcriptional regulator [Streptomyces rugosispiralis]MCQ8192736.1 LysR family transcriptional regulator [Streptomyces rugosispiralis]
MDTRLLKTFAALARTGSFTATATELHLAQSTVTVQIRTLERELGTRLFDRLPSGALPTSAGRRLLTEAEEVLDAEARLRAVAAAGNGDGAVEGPVALGAGESLCASHLPRVIASLRRSHPGIDLHLHPAGSAAAVEGLRTGRLDLVLLLEPDVADADLVARPIAREPLVYVAAPGHPLAGREAGWDQLAEQSFFVHEQGCSYSDHLVRTLLDLPGPAPRLTRFGSIEAARACVAAGLGLTLLPRATVERQLADGYLAEVHGPAIPPVPVQLTRHRRRWTSPAARAVADELTRLLAA